MTSKYADLGTPAQEWLDFVANAPPPPALGGSLELMRSSMDKTKAAVNAKTPMPRETLEVKDLKMPTRDGSGITVRLYKPKDVKEAIPAIVLFHGGGYALGSLENEEVSCRTLADSLQVGVLNVDYRLAPEHPFPTGLQDAHDSVKWVAANYQSLGLDLQKGFIVGGFSCGSTFTAVITQIARDEGLSPPITGQIMSCPSVINPGSIPAKWKDDLLSYEQNADAPVINSKSMALFSSFIKIADGTDPRASPILHPNLKGLPRVYFQITGLDPLRDEGFLYEKLLREQYTETKVDVYPGLPHVFWNFPGLPSSEKWLKDLVAGTKWLLNQK